MAGEPGLDRQDRARLRQMAGQWQMAMGPAAAKDLSAGPPRTVALTSDGYDNRDLFLPGTAAGHAQGGHRFGHKTVWNSPDGAEWADRLDTQMPRSTAQ